MAAKLEPQTSFSYGELSPDLYGHTELKQYKSAVKYISNFICTIYGGVKKRSGTIFINQVKYGA